MFGKAKNKEFQGLKQAKFLIPMFGIAKVPNSNIWKTPKFQFQQPKFTIPMFGKAKN